MWKCSPNNKRREAGGESKKERDSRLVLSSIYLSNLTKSMKRPISARARALDTRLPQATCYNRHDLVDSDATRK